MTRPMWIAFSIIAVLLIVVIVVVAILIAEMNAAEAHQNYLNCMARWGYYPDELNADTDGMFEAAQRCGR